MLRCVHPRLSCFPNEQGLLALYVELMTANNISAPTPLYVASGLLTYMEADGEGPRCREAACSAHGCQLRAPHSDTLAMQPTCPPSCPGASWQMPYWNAMEPPLFDACPGRGGCLCQPPASTLCVSPTEVHRKLSVRQSLQPCEQTG